jgi:hypothetical protein
MNQRDFWKQLEYTICRALDSTPPWAGTGWWCDGFIPDAPDPRFDVDPALHDPMIIRGLVWMARGAHQESWRFTARAQKPGFPSDDESWDELIPMTNPREWLELDFDAKTMVITLPYTCRAGIARYEHMWTTQRGEWIVICENPASPDPRGGIFYHVPTDCMRILELDAEARHVFEQLRASGAKIIDEHPTLGKVKPPTSGIKNWFGRLRGR